MHTGRGHRKLRLTSKKHYERDKYAKRLMSRPYVLPTPVAELKLSVPLDYFTKATLPSLDILHARILKMEIPPTKGINFTA